MNELGRGKHSLAVFNTVFPAFFLFPISLDYDLSCQRRRNVGLKIQRCHFGLYLRSTDRIEGYD